MMLKLRIRLITLFLGVAVSSQAQTNQFRYKRDLQKANANWHSVEIQNGIFKNAQSGLEDLRIFGVKGKDSVEVPYILEQSANQITERETPFNIINQSKNGSGFFYTFQTPSVTTINQIKLSFKQENFDWRVTLEGSNDNRQWFTLLNNSRILSIKNTNTDYHFTDLNFPASKFSYFRIAVKAGEQPLLNAAKILKIDTIKGVYKDINYKSYQLFNNVKTKQSIIDVVLASPTPTSTLRIDVKSNFDFYRTMKIEYATDSFKTDKGIQYNYEPLYDGTISSLETPEFNFKSTLISKLKITIENNDNQPLRITSIMLKGPIYELIGRYDDPSLTYALYYGNRSINQPNYELKNFENKIPMSITPLKLGEEVLNPTFKLERAASPLFENKLWLWCIMGIIITLLGFFAYKMLKD